MKNSKEIANLKNEESKKVQEGPFYFFSWILKAEIIILLVFFIIGIIFNSISDETKFEYKYNIEKRMYKNVENTSNDFSKIEEAIEENKKLSEEEKLFIKESIREEVIENIEYIDVNLVVKRLSNLSVKYKGKSSKKSINKFLKIGGKYSSLTNQIEMYQEINEIDELDKKEKNAFNFNSCDKKIYFHELNHLLTKNSISTFFDSWARNLENKYSNWNFWNKVSNSIKLVNKNIFLEAINEIFSIEYFDNKNVEKNLYEGYNQEKKYAYVLAEILPEETLRKYKYHDNESILITAFLDIENNIDEVYRLFYSINKVMTDKNETEETKKAYKNIHDSLKFFYEKRFNSNMSEDIEILLYLYDTPILSEEERAYVRDKLEMEEYDEIKNIIPKGYFSENYKKENSKIKVEYYKDGTLMLVEMD